MLFIYLNLIKPSPQTTNPFSSSSICVRDPHTHTHSESTSGSTITTTTTTTTILVDNNKMQQLETTAENVIGGQQLIDFSLDSTEQESLFNNNNNYNTTTGITTTTNTTMGQVALGAPQLVTSDSHEHKGMRNNII